MKVFIDTNMLLDMYHLSGPDLEELRKFVALIENGKIEVLMPQQVVDEFWRNREGVIADALKRFDDTRAQAVVPNIIRSYPEAADLKKAVDRVKSMASELKKRAVGDIESGALKADEVLGALFSAVKITPVSGETVSRARLRVDIGNPPGKRGDLGDAINWECLLGLVPQDETSEVVLISADGHFESELTSGQLREFLVREWQTTHPHCALRLDKSLPEFLSRDFAEIKLADEVDKSIAIERLEGAGNFVSVHSALRRLSEYDDFTQQEVARLLQAFVENRQIYWIINDDDVFEFALNLILIASSDDTKELASQLQELIAE